jgi:hypothetical protein
MTLATISASEIFQQHQSSSMFNKRRFVQKTRWLSPYTRWATRFAMSTPSWLPDFMRHAPLRLSSLILRGYHRTMR